MSDVISLGSPCVGGTLSPSRITDLDVTNAPGLSSGGPRSVPSRISVVLVEEAKAGGTPRQECPRDDQDRRSLAGVAKPASVTVYDESLGSTCVGGTLSSSDMAGRLLPVAPAGISVPVGPIDPAGPDGPLLAGGPVGPLWTMSPSDSGPVGPDGTLSPVTSDHAGLAGRHVAVCPVGPFGTLSPSDCHPADPAAPCVAGGTVGPDGMLSPFTSDHAGPAGRHVAVSPVGPFGTLSPSDCYPAGPAGPFVAGGPAGPDGTLSPFTSDPAGPAGRQVAVRPGGPFGTLSPSTSGSAILVDPGGSALLPGEGIPRFCPGVLMDDLVLGAVVPLPAMFSRCEHYETRCLVGSGDGRVSSVVARVSCAALPGSTDTTFVCVDEFPEWDILDQFETINGMLVYYGGELYDSEDSDWDDPYEIASAAYVEDYNFDVPEGMDLMVHEQCRGLYGSDIREDQQTGLTHVCQTSLRDTRDEWDMVDVDSLTEAFAEDVQDADDLYQRIVSSDEEDFGDPDDGSSTDNDRHPGLTPVGQTLLRDVLDTMDIDSVTRGFAGKLPVPDDFYAEIVSSDEEDFSEPDDGSVEDVERNTWADWVVLHLGLHLARFRRKQTICGRRLCSVTAC